MAISTTVPELHIAPLAAGDPRPADDGRSAPKSAASKKTNIDWTKNATIIRCGHR
jgi:hypothetical protein